MTHVVQYVESERGWGGEIWHRGFNTLEEAQSAVTECNKDLPEDTPDYYIVARYLGEMAEVPGDYKH